MKNKIFVIVLIVVIVVGAGWYFWGKDNKNEAGIANPASVYCVDQGGRSEIRTNSDGSQTGYCVFSNGKECDEWAFYRSECLK